MLEIHKIHIYFCFEIYMGKVVELRNFCIPDKLSNITTPMFISAKKGRRHHIDERNTMQHGICVLCNKNEKKSLRTRADIYEGFPDIYGVLFRLHSSVAQAI